MVLICILTMDNGMEHLFICSLAICTPSLEKYLYGFFAYF